MNSLLQTSMKKLGIPTKGMGFDYIKNTSWVTGAKIIEHIFSYLIIIMVSRFLGAEGLGQYSFLFAFAGFFFVFADWGVTPLMIKDFAQGVKNKTEYLSSIVSFKLLLTLVSFIFYFIVIFFINKNEILLSLIIVGLLTSISRFTTVIDGLLRVDQKGKSLALAHILERFISVILAFIFLFFYQSLTLFILGLFIARFFKSIFLLLVTRSYFKNFSFKINTTLLRRLIVEGYPFLLIAFFSVIYIQMDSIMLSFIKGDIITGLYNAPYKLINVLNVVPAVLLTFAFPLFSKFYISKRSQAFSLLKKLLFFSIATILPIVLLVFFFGDWALSFIYNFQQVESFVAFKILIIAQVFVFLTTIIGNFIAAIGKQKLFAKIAGVGALVNIALNFILIPQYSLYGAAIATLSTYVLMFILITYFVKKF